jgi:hypothetical protein
MQKKTKFDSSVNILGGIPDYSIMLDYVCETYGNQPKNQGSFIFRTEKALTRFVAAIEKSVLVFSSDKHKKIFFDAIGDDTYTTPERMLILFWQLVYSNELFREISQNVLMRAVYSGRVQISAEDVLAFLRQLKENFPKEFDWSESTLKVTASKYLTIVKKLGLAEGSKEKALVHPVLTDRLFVYFIRFVQVAHPQDKTLDNPYIIFGFFDKQIAIKRLKKIENTVFWDISQIGEDITIDLK